MRGYRSMVWMAMLLVTAPAAAQQGEGGELEVSFADPDWDGVEVPEGQQCQRFDGHGRTPPLLVKGVPAAASAIVLEFSDRSYQPMDNGGHGMVGYRIESGSSEVEIPAAPGHTLELPADFFVVAAHKAPNWDTAGAYLPPCSGGRGNEYYVTVKAVHIMGDERHELAQAKLEMGKY